MTVIFTAGGTGGHIYPAIAVAEELTALDRTAEVRFIGGTRPVERAILERSGFRSETIEVTGMPRRLSPEFFTFFQKLVSATIRSRKLLKKTSPDCMLATGGYVSGPPVLAARSLGIPVFLLEQNSFPGVAVRRLARFADTVFLGFAEANQYLGPHTRIVVTGNPVRRGIDSGDRGKTAEMYGLDPVASTVLVFGGSQGARKINETVAALVPEITGRGIQLLWQTGSAEYDRWAAHDMTGQVCVRAYIDDMAGAYALSDVVVGRAGAMTIAELTVSGVPSILVPLPAAAGNHQEYNARTLADAGAARMILERDLTPVVLKEELFVLTGDNAKRQSMSMAARALGNRNAARDIATYILNQCGVN